MEKLAPKKKDQRWGKYIAALYSGFALLMIVMVIVAARQHFDLVEPDYYQQGLKYQDRIRNSERAKSLSATIEASLNASGDSLVVAFPPECALDSIGGVLWLYRPSNSGWDRSVPISVGKDGTQLVPAQSLVPGLWRIKAEWVWRGESYYSEIDVFIPRRG